jgi:hypothetical protein
VPKPRPMIATVTLSFVMTFSCYGNDVVEAFVM